MVCFSIYIGGAHYFSGMEHRELMDTLDEIRDELRELRALYGNLVDRLVRVEEPTEEERRAIEEEDELAGEDELFRVLGD